MEMNLEVPESLNQFTHAMFVLLWGQDRPAVLTVVDQAYEWIWRQQIVLAGKTPRRLSDIAIAAELRISRTPVRQALDRLAQEGLVHFDPRRGFWTHVYTAEDVQEIYQIREATEVLALRLAAPHLKQADLETHLKTLLEIRATLPNPHYGDFLEADIRLHNFLIHNCGNERLIRLLSALRSQLALFQVRDTPYPDRIAIALDDHERFIRALLDHNTELAAQMLGQHIQNAKEGVLADMFPEYNNPQHQMAVSR
jgi:DNA-binding GntR family transcriptional regulator